MSLESFGSLEGLERIEDELEGLVKPEFVEKYLTLSAMEKIELAELEAEGEANLEGEKLARLRRLRTKAAGSRLMGILGK
jgi:hypothetical protein